MPRPFDLLVTHHRDQASQIRRFGLPDPEITSVWWLVSCTRVAMGYKAIVG